MQKYQWGLFITALLVGGIANSAPIYQQKKMANGLTLITFPDNKVPLATVVLVFKSGANTQTKDTVGLTHVWEHMFFTGNRKYRTESAFQKRQRQLGMRSNASTGDEVVDFFFTLPSANLAAGLELMSECIRTPLLEKKALDYERVVVLDEYDRFASEPGFDLRRVQSFLIYGEQQHRRDSLGRREIIAKVERDALMKIKENYFVPENAALVVGGTFDQAELEKVVTQYFGGWKTPNKWKLQLSGDFPPFPKTTRLVEVSDQTQNIQVSYTFQGPRVGAEDRDTVVADVLFQSLGHRSGKFFKKFVDSGLALAAGGHYYTQSQAAELMLAGTVQAKNAKQFASDILSEVKEWIKPDYFTQEQLGDVARGMRSDRLKRQNKPSEFTHELSWSWAVTGMTYFDHYLDDLATVTIPDLVAFTKKYLLNKDYVEMWLLRPEDAKLLGLSDNLDPWLNKYSMTRSSEVAKK